MCPMTESFISRKNVVLRASVFLVDSYKAIAAISTRLVENFPQDNQEVEACPELVLFGSLVCRNISSLFPVPSVLMGDW